MRNRFTCLLSSALCLAATVAQAQGTSNTAQQFQHLEDNWSVALVNKDQYGLENLLAPTFINISATAQVDTRNQYIANTLNGLPLPLLSVEQKVVSVRMVNDVALVEGTYILRLRDGAHVRDERGIFTHVYSQSRDTWSCVNAQRTIVVDQVEGQRGSGGKSEKRSNAPLPFHIPLVYKGSQSATTQPGSQAAQPVR